jgi:DNA repair photolyase
MYSLPMDRPLKGRGALSNPDGRFRELTTETVDDGWFVEETAASVATSVEPDRARSVINTNDSPDIPFDYSINPYRGCEHGCVYCVSGDTQILMADGTTRPLARIRAGDSIYGTVRRGWYRRYVEAQVLAHWSVVKPAYRITLADDTVLVAGSDHRFLTERGWKFVTGTESGRARRPHLTTGNKLMGVGAFAVAPEKDTDYRRGYLCGLVRGDGQIGSYSYVRPGRGRDNLHQFRLALCDRQALERAQDWLRLWDVETTQFAFSAGSATRRPMQAIRTSARGRVERVRALIAWPDSPSRGWHAGFLAGIFDAEGSYSGGVLRISNTDPRIIDWASRSLRTFGFEFVVERSYRVETKPIDVVRLLGGLREHLRFFHSVDPAITRKRDISGQAVKSEARLGVVGIEPLKGAMRLYDLTTSTGDFIANGVISHNCYARPSHAYLGLSPGLDFETRLLYKADAARLLTEELARPGYVCKPITLGANTDPYQPVEKRLRVTRSILEVLERSNHPVSVVTKGTLVLRDLDLLGRMAREGLASVAVSITTLDADLKRVLEPRAAAPQARLGVVRQLASAGVPTRVLVAPVIPALTDHELEAIIRAAAQAGASGAGYVLLRLPREVSDLFREWLATHYPDRARHVMSLIHDARGGRDNDPRFGSRMRGTGPYADLLRARFQAACRRFRIETGHRWQLSTALFRPPGSHQLELGI